MACPLSTLLSHSCSVGNNTCHARLCVFQSSFASCQRLYHFDPFRKVARSRCSLRGGSVLAVRASFAGFDGHVEAASELLSTRLPQLVERTEGLLCTIADVAVSTDAAVADAVQKPNRDWLSGLTDGLEGILKGCADVDAAKVGLIRQMWKMDRQQSCFSNAPLATLLNVMAIPCFSGAAHAEFYDRQVRQIYGDLGAGLEIGLQVLYLAALLCLVGVASYFVVKQVLIRRDLESAARDLQDRVRTGEALPVEYFELGAVMLRKRFFTLASRYLEQAIDKWDGDPQELAQVHNALGFSYMNDENIDEGIEEYQRAVKLQPGYTVAWNNLGNAYEKKKELSKALDAYEQALKFDPTNATAKEYRDALAERVKRLKGVSLK